ncbi:hypothetical protein Igag_0076 [Ignisphaera aggregans DSM 17230]|uniref:Uncharacterized protein n=1 Tax=Ignisphaera aggregans (strain DSM 17230 / JCM 13409 / AQ1.S1) TaxID=583356 RepID=E0SPI5_IGNAA|nr:hypothetical protein Igag_0076 [Ignisphaera aggregans DSM 17230]
MSYGKVILEYYTLEEINLDKLSIGLYKKIDSIETNIPQEELSKFIYDEDQFISWISNTNNSSNMIKATVLYNGMMLEGLYIKSLPPSDMIINSPSLSKARKIYLLYDTHSSENISEVILRFPNSNSNIVTYDLSTQEYYVYENPIKIIDPKDLYAIVIELQDSICFFDIKEYINKHKEVKKQRSKTEKKRRKRKKKGKKRKSKKKKSS